VTNEKQQTFYLQTQNANESVDTHNDHNFGYKVTYTT